MQDPSQEGGDTETINVVPLADLTLVLLIILMVISPMISQSMIRVSTPTVKAQKKITEPKKNKDDKKPTPPLIIAITTKGYTLNNTRAKNIEQLMEAVNARLIEEPDRVVLVTADDVISVGDVVEVLDLAKQNGAEKVSLLKRTMEKKS